MPFALPKIPHYGFEDSSLILPVRMHIKRLDRPAMDAAGTPGMDDVFDEPSRNRDGTDNLIYITPNAEVLAQFMPLSVTDHANKEIPGISGNDLSFKNRWLLSKKDLRDNGYIHTPTQRPLIGAGDRIQGLYDAESGALLESFDHTDVRIVEIHARHPSRDAFYVIFLNDFSNTSQILA